jgi:hypothetical protein
VEWTGCCGIWPVKRVYSPKHKYNVQLVASPTLKVQGTLGVDAQKLSFMGTRASFFSKSVGLVVPMKEVKGCSGFKIEEQ